MMALVTLISYKLNKIKTKIINKKQKVILLSEKSKSEKLILLCSSARTTTFLNTKTKIYIPSRSYPGGVKLPTGGAGKGPKLPGTNVPTTNKESINLTPSQAHEAISNKNSQPYIPPYITETEKTSSTPKPITPNHNKDPWKDTKLPQNINTIEEKLQKANIIPKVEEKANKVPKVEEKVNIIPKVEEKPIPYIEEWKKSLWDKFKEENNIKDKENKPSTELKEEKNTSSTDKKPKTLKNISGKDYTTKIEEATTTISDEDLIKELKSRELIKEDNGNTAVPIKVESGDYILVGGSKHKIKLTPLGQAYGKDYQKPAFVPQEDTFKNDDDIELMIITPPKPSENTFIETGKQKHMLIAHSKDNDTYYAIGYLTSKKSGEHLSDTQFKKFQQQGEELKNDEKKQKFFLFDHMEEVSKTDVNIAELSEEYLTQIDPQILNKIVETTQMLEKKPVVIFNKDGITKENGIEMCKKHDNNINKKIKHPQTPDQIQQQQEAKEKQQEKQKEEKELKDKNKDKHDQNPSSPF